MRWFDESLRLAHIPVWARYAATTVFVAVAVGARYPLIEAVAPNSYPFLLYFPAIILAAALFDRGSGIFAVFLSALCADYVSIAPIGSLAIEHSRDAIALALFGASGLATAALIEAFHRAHHDLSVSHLRLQAAHEELTKAHERARSSEEQKDLLMQELAHRTKNDLMMVSALVQMQSRKVADATARDILLSAVERIHVLGRVHDRLTRRDGAVVIDVRNFLCGLCDDLRSAIAGARPLALLCDVDSHALSHSQAVALGLVANELITNAVKYAFPDDRDGTIRVAFARAGDEFRLAVEDDGVGLSAQPAPATEAGAGTGQRLVRALTLQLRGRFECLPRTPGTAAIVTFPAEASELR